MIAPCKSHKECLRFVCYRARQCGGLATRHRHYHGWRRLQAINLDVAYPGWIIFRRLAAHGARSRMHAAFLSGHGMTFACFKLALSIAIAEFSTLCWPLCTSTALLG